MPELRIPFDQYQRLFNVSKDEIEKKIVGRNLLRGEKSPFVVNIYAQCLEIVKKGF